MFYQPRPRVESKKQTPQQTPPLPPLEAQLAGNSAPTGTGAAEPFHGNAGGSGRGNRDLGNQMVEMQGVYIISVAARILDMHPQTLRKYERLGLINPGRTIGMLRLYSAEDIRKVRLIRHLVHNMGFNLAGVEHTLSMVEGMLRMKRRLTTYAQGTPMVELIEQEIAQLFRDMNLPVEE